MKVRSGASVAGDSATSAVWTLASRVTGFARVLLIGAVLGPSYFGNLFQLGNQLPWLAFDLAIGALLGSLLVPALVRHVSKGDAAAVERIANGFLGLVVTAFAGIVIVVMAASGLIAEGFALPITDAQVHSDFVAAAVPLLLLTAPQLVGYGIAITGQAVQQAMGHYRLPAAASIVENVVVCATLAVFAVVFGFGVELADVTTLHILMLGGGSSLGVVLHAGLQLWGVRSLGIKIRPTAGWRDPDVKSLLRQALPTSGTALLNGCRLITLLTISNTVPGGVVAFQLALNILNVPVALGAKPVVHALLPRLSRAYSSNDTAEFSERYLRGVGFAFLITAPAAAAVVSLGWLVSSGLAVGEMGTDNGRRLLAFGIAGVGGAILGDGLYHLSSAASYSRLDPFGPLQAQVLRFGGTVLGAASTLAWVDGSASILGLALSMSAADLLAAWYLHRRVSATLSTGDYNLSTSMARTLSCSMFGFGAAGIIGWWAVRGWSLSPIVSLAAVAGLGGAGLALYVGTRLKLDHELATLFSEVRNRNVTANETVKAAT